MSAFGNLDIKMPGMYNANNVTNQALTSAPNLSIATTKLTGTLQAGTFPALTGDVTTTAGSLATTLAAVNTNIGTFQGLTINGKGLVTAATNQSYLTANQTITLSSDATGSGTTGITVTLATVNSTSTASLGGPGLSLIDTANGKGLVTSRKQAGDLISYTYFGGL